MSYLQILRHPRISELFVLLGMILLLLFPSVSSGQSMSGVQGTAEPFRLELRSFMVETATGGVQIESGLVLDKTTVIRSLLRDGAVLTLSCKLTLERLRKVLSNDVVAEKVVEYHLRHDALTREFVLNTAETSPLRNRNLDALLASTWKNMQFMLPLEAPLLSGETYRVRLDLTLQHAEVPPWLEKALFFWSWDVAPSVSVSRDFVY